MGDLAPVLGHQGGWDEILMFLIPIVLAVGAVRWVERRSRRRDDDRSSGPAPPGSPPAEHR